MYKYIQQAFPIDDCKKKQWIEVLQLENRTIPKKAVVCSKHFNKNDFVGSSNKLFPTAVPHSCEMDKMICRLCLDEKKMYLLLKNGEENAEVVAGIIGQYFDLPLDNISHLICTECWNQVYDFHVFYLFVQERQKNFHLESQNLVYSSTASSDRVKDTKAEGNVLLVETEDTTNTNAEKDDEFLQTENEDDDDDGVVFEAVDIDEEDELYTYAEEVDTLGEIDDETESNIDAEAGDSLEDADDYNNARIDDDGDDTSIETDEENTNIRDIDGKKVETPNPQEDAEDTTYSDLTDPISVESSKFSTTASEYPCNKPEKSDVSEKEIKCAKTCKKQKPRLQNRRKRGEINLVIANHAGVLKCDLCAEPQETFKKLLQHFREAHDCKGYVKCCGNRYSSSIRYADHLELHVNPNIFKCERCSKVLASRNSYITHMRIIHASPGSLKYQCPHCPIKYAIKCKLTLHIRRRHMNGEYKCEECNKIYKTLEKLKSHQTVIHKGATTTICDICGRSFNTKANCEKHKTNIHPEVVSTGQQSKAQQSKAHQDVQQDQQECLTCHKWFKNSKKLQKHSYYHRKEEKTEYICDLCGVVKKKKILLYRHKYLHHADRRFNCSHCDKAFKTKDNLKEHEAIHRGIRNYKCELCDRTFTARSNWATHKKTVHKDKCK